MIICSCNVISDHEVRGAVAGMDAPPVHMSHVYRALGRKPKCGHCKRTIKETVRRIGQDTEGACAS